MKTCSVDGCDHPHIAKDMCSKHYAAQRYTNNREHILETNRVTNLEKALEITE